MSGNDRKQCNINVHIATGRPTLYIFRYNSKTTESPSITELQSYPVTSATAARSTESNMLDVVATAAGSPHLHVIPTYGNIFSVALPEIAQDGRDEIIYSISTALSMSAPSVRSETREGKRSRHGPVLLDAVGSRLSVLLSSGRTIRVCMDVTPKDRLVKQSLHYARVIAGADVCDVLRQMVFDYQPAQAEFSALAADLIARLGSAGHVSTSVPSAWNKLRGLSQRRSGTVSYSRRSTVVASARAEALSAKAPVSRTIANGLLVTIHIVAEDCRMDSSRRDELFAAARLTAQLAALLDAPAYLDHWLRISPLLGRDLPDISSEIWTRPSSSAHALSPLVQISTEKHVPYRNRWIRLGSLSEQCSKRLLKSTSACPSPLVVRRDMNSTSYASLSARFWTSTESYSPRTASTRQYRPVLRSRG